MGPVLISRRGFLSMALAGRLFAPELQRYSDPATELDVERLTDPGFASGLTVPHHRQFAHRTYTLVYWSERVEGTRQAFQLDLNNGASRQVTEATHLDSSSLLLSADDRTLNYFDGPVLMEATLSSLHTRELYRVPEGASRSGLTAAGDGSLLFTEGRDGHCRMVRVAHGGPTTVLETEGEIVSLVSRPHQPQILWRTGDDFWIAGVDGSGRHRLKIEPGRTGEAVWTQSGKTLLYLHIPNDPKELITLRENDPGDGGDKLLAKTSQFESFAPNGDGSVFVGASRSRASAYVLILLRVTRRELTLCEHHASDPHMVQPIFSPDSQHVYFTSDRHGKSALYRVHVDKFVEGTSDG